MRHVSVASHGMSVQFVCNVRVICDGMCAQCCIGFRPFFSAAVAAVGVVATAGKDGGGNGCCVVAIVKAVVTVAEKVVAVK